MGGVREEGRGDGGRTEGKKEGLGNKKICLQPMSGSRALGPSCSSNAFPRAEIRTGVPGAGFVETRMEKGHFVKSHLCCL